MEKILLSRHLDDVDDLRSYGRDAPLEDSQVNLDKLENIANSVSEKMSERKKSSVMFIVSPRLRARQTAVLVAEKINEKSAERVKIRYSVDETLKSTEQGSFILPDEYRPGERFRGLELAGKIFAQETHGSDVGKDDNIDYRYGDPVALPEGGYRYPELVGQFSTLGETYRESLIRIYATVLRASTKYKKFIKNTEIIIVAHGQIYHVLKGLAEIARRIREHEIFFEKGDSIKLLWQIYNDCEDDQKVAGICMPLDIDWLNDAEIIKFLKNELEYLTSNK